MPLCGPRAVTHKISLRFPFKLKLEKNCSKLGLATCLTRRSVANQCQNRNPASRSNLATRASPLFQEAAQFLPKVQRVVQGKCPLHFVNLNGVVCSNTLFSNTSALTSSLSFWGNSTCKILEHLVCSNTSGFQFWGPLARTNFLSAQCGLPTSPRWWAWSRMEARVLWARDFSPNGPGSRESTNVSCPRNWKEILKHEEGEP